MLQCTWEDATTHLSHLQLHKPFYNTVQSDDSGDQSIKPQSNVLAPTVKPRRKLNSQWTISNSWIATKDKKIQLNEILHPGITGIAK